MYLLGFVVVFIAAIVELFTRRLHTFPLFFLVSIFLFSIAAFRVDGIFDYESYKELSQFVALEFEGIGSLLSFYFEKAKIEPVSLLIIWVSGFFDPYFNVFFFFSLCSVFAYAFVIYRLSPFPLLTILLFFSHEYLYLLNGQIRAGLAYGIAWLAVLAFIERKLLGFLSLFLLAVFIHYSAAVLLVIVFFWNYRSLIAVNFLLFFSILIGCTGIGGLIVVYLYDSLGQPFFLERYVDGVGKYGVFSLDITLLKLLVVYILLTWYIWFDREILKRRDFYVLYVMLAMGIAIRVALFEFNELGARLSSLYSMSLLFLVPVVVSRFKNNVILVFIVVMVAMMQFFLNYQKIEIYNFDMAYFF
jgi:hypothetical protein